MTERNRREGYVISARNEAYADLLFDVVNRIDTGTPAYLLVGQLRTICALIDQGNL